MATKLDYLMRWRMGVDYVVAFFAGSLFVIVQAFFRASVIHADETARHEQTMAPGITMFVGMIIAPLAGAVVVLIQKLFRHFWKKPRHRDRAVNANRSGPSP